MLLFGVRTKKINKLTKHLKEMWGFLFELKKKTDAEKKHFSMFLVIVAIAFWLLPMKKCLKSKKKRFFFATFQGNFWHGNKKIFFVENSLNLKKRSNREKRWFELNHKWMRLRNGLHGKNELLSWYEWFDWSLVCWFDCECKGIERKTTKFLR